MNLTQDQILALAPDSASGSAGRGLASVSKWVLLACDDGALWGECQGSGAKPYQVQIDLSEPAFRCSCPSRKFPCKHGIALFLLFTSHNSEFKRNPQPDWVIEWLTKREARATAKAEPPNPKSPESEKRSADAQLKRSAEREQKVSAGIEELDRWLEDLVRTGFASVQSNPSRYWNERAARMVDAQAAGLARRIRELGTIVSSGDGWAERMVMAAGKLHLLTHAYSRLPDLPEQLRATVRAHIGWSHRQEDLLAVDGIKDRWLVAGRRIYEEDHITVQRTWLLSATQNYSAAIYSFAAPGLSLDTSPMLGVEIEAELVLFPGAPWVGGRAVIKAKSGLPVGISSMSSGLSDDWRTQYAKSLAMDPWLESFPVCAGNCVPIIGPNGTHLVMSDESLPVDPRSSRTWQLLSLSGGMPIKVFGEWDGGRIYPLSAVADGRYVSFAPAGKAV